MREIKFRAWDSANNEFMYWGIGDMNNDGSSCTFPSGRMLKAPQMQYTGLKDKNGVEIYEGDIVEFRANYTSKPCGFYNAKVVIGDYKLELHAENGVVYDAEEETDEFPYAHCQVIGNIYENPELLNN